MPTKLSQLSRYLCLFSLILIFAGVAYGHPGQEEQLSVIMSKGPMKFQLTGAPGIFREVQSAYYGVEVIGNKEILLQFSASKLEYRGPYEEEAELDVVYFVNNDGKQKFTQEQSLVLRRGKGLHEFSLQGQVTVDAIETQPAGDYEGTIIITVFEQPGQTQNK